MNGAKRITTSIRLTLFRDLIISKFVRQSCGQTRTWPVKLSDSHPLGGQQPLTPASGSGFDYRSYINMLNSLICQTRITTFTFPFDFSLFGNQGAGLSTPRNT